METAAYALAAVTAFIISFFASDDELFGSASCSGLLVVFWAINNAMWMLVDLRTWSLLTDTLFTLLVFLVFLVLRQPWALVLALLYAVDALLDGCWALDVIAPATWARTENAVFLVQLLAACWPGIRGAFAASRQGLLRRDARLRPAIEQGSGNVAEQVSG